MVVLDRQGLDMGLRRVPAFPDTREAKRVGYAQAGADKLTRLFLHLRGDATAQLLLERFL